MKQTTQAVCLAVIMAVTFGSISLGEESPREYMFPELSGPYLGQESPGKSAKIFAPGIISTELHDDAAPAFSKNGKEVFFRIVFKSRGTSYGKIFTSREENGTWTEPEIAPFCDRRMWGAIKFSKDGKRLYTSVNTADGDGFDMDLVSIERADGNFEKVSVIEELITSNHDYGLFEAQDSRLHWISEDASDGSIKRHYTARIVGNQFKDIEETDNFVEGGIVHCFGVDDSYVILSAEVSPRNRDLFVAFKDASGRWSDPINLGPQINSDQFEKSASISPDGKYLFFVSNRRGEQAQPKRFWDSPLFTELQRIWRCDVYWVETSIIDDLRHEYLANNEK